MRLALLLLPVMLIASGTVFADGERERQRALFLDTWDRLAERKSVDVDGVAEKLDGYILAPYLHWQDLRYRLQSADDREIGTFLEQHPTLAVSDLLRGQWLHRLGRAGQWEPFLSAYQGHQSATLGCYRLRALKARGTTGDSWVEEAKALWMVGHSQPNACDPVFAVLYNNNLLDADSRWTRVERIMAAGDSTLARALRPRLDADQRKWLDIWLAVVANPVSSLRQVAFDVTDPRGQMILETGLRRLAVRNRPTAIQLLDHYSDKGLLEQASVDSLRRTIALRSAWAREENALALLDDLPATAVNDDVLEWSARLALVQQDWHRLAHAVDKLPAHEQDRGEWRYWKAEALRQTGSKESALSLFTELARERHYYGFLAADELGLPYAMNHQLTWIDADELAALKQHPAVQRALEFHALGFVGEGRREWLLALRQLDQDGLRHAAVLASRMGWYDRAVHAANRAGLHDDLDLRFPLALSDKFERHSREQGVDLALAYAISRKESIFTADARSPVGALGLMQVMPATGRMVAKRLGLPAPSDLALIDPDLNLRLGTAYLAQMLERFGGNVIMTAASYNAGPGRVEGWRRDNQGQPAAIWIENITYGETRDYVKSVLAFRVVYDWQLRGEPRRLAYVMPVMPGPDDPGPAYALGDTALKESGN